MFKLINKKSKIYQTFMLNSFVRLLCAPVMLFKLKKIYYRFQKTDDYKYIKKLENKYAGKRCFVIGNGPSLTPSDLDMITGEISIASNKIFEIFSSTKWRPLFYFCLDPVCYSNNAVAIEHMECENKFIRYYGEKNKELNKNMHYVCIGSERYVINISRYKKKNISIDCAKNFSRAFTITTTAIEFAIYMGFKEIYLIGIDHNFPLSIDQKGKKKTNSNIKSHFYVVGNEDSRENFTYIDATTSCYEAYRDYANENGITIKNASRNSKLEVFEKVLLEDIL